MDFRQMRDEEFYFASILICLHFHYAYLQRTQKLMQTIFKHNNTPRSFPATRHSYSLHLLPANHAGVTCTWYRLEVRGWTTIFCSLGSLHTKQECWLRTDCTKCSPPVSFCEAVLSMFTCAHSSSVWKLFHPKHVAQTQLLDKAHATGYCCKKISAQTFNLSK